MMNPDYIPLPPYSLVSRDKHYRRLTSAPRFRPRRILYWICGALLLLFVVIPYLRRRPSEPTSLGLSHHASASLPVRWHYSKKKKPKITIIGIWSPRTKASEIPVYLPYFIFSVEANPTVDLLLVEIDKFGAGCHNFSSAPNIKTLCLTNEAYWALHTDLLCKKWQCNEAERKGLLNYLAEEFAAWDVVHSGFRILRNAIFLPWINPATTIWGWCDLDTFWGNFERTFPWDVAHNFDVLAASMRPEPNPRRLLFTPGHMSFFRHSPETMAKMLDYPKWSSMLNFLTSKRIRVDAEESEFSHWIFSDNKQITFLQFEALASGWISLFMSDSGTYYTTIRKEQMGDITVRKRFLRMVRSLRQPGIRHTFSPEGRETLADIYTNGTDWPQPLWYPPEFCTWVHTHWDEQDRWELGYFMRREPGGTITQRVEPRRAMMDENLWADEGLYHHPQEIKRQDWYARLGSHEFKPHETLYMSEQKLIEIWDEQGNIVFTTEVINTTAVVT